jgi:hypothetical protein
MNNKTDLTRDCVTSKKDLFLNELLQNKVKF